MAKVEMKSRKKVNQAVSSEPGVIAEVARTARDIGKEASMTLAMHRDTGAAQIEITHGTVDSFVSLVDEAAVSIEFGHGTNWGPNGNGRYVRGLYIVTGAAGLI